VALIIPTDEFPPAMPSTDQFTDEFEKPSTGAVNCCVALGARSTEAGVIASAPTVTVALALIAVLATLVAVTV
jgi:hypothetical protein